MLVWNSVGLAGRWRTTPFKGMSGTPTSRSIRSAPTERGIAGEDAGHARSQGGCAFPRLRDRHLGRRLQARPSRSAVHQRRTGAEGARGCHSQEMLRIHATRQAHPPGCTTTRNGLQHRHPVSGGIPGPRAILPAGLQRPSPVATPLGHEPVAGQDAGNQVPDVRASDSPEVPEDHRHASRHSKGVGSRCRTRYEEATGSSFRRHRIALAE